jgi:hypothetical protein
LGAAILYHAPTTWPVLLILVPILAVRRQWRALGVLAGNGLEELFNAGNS